LLTLEGFSNIGQYKEWKVLELSKGLKPFESWLRTRIEGIKNMSDLRITLIQSPIHWHDIQANLDMFRQKIADIGQETDVIILPEMFTTGFTMQPELVAEPLGGRTMQWMQHQAKATNAVVTGSFVQQSEGTNEEKSDDPNKSLTYWNTLIWMQPDGQYELYQKRHLFRMAGEHDAYEKGTSRLVVSWRGWRICPMICYDLRFPIWARNTNMDYDVLLYIASWPQARRHAWRTLIQARAIENLSYGVGVNRIGTDHNGYQYLGDSLVADFKGELMLDAQAQEMTQTVSFSRENLSDFRAKFPFYLDADPFTLD
jgi:predicted amidohydrolase